MATRKKPAAAPIDDAPVNPFANLRRHYAENRYEWIEFKPVTASADTEPLKVKIRTNLTFADLDAIPYGANVKFATVWPLIESYVVDWNVTAVNLESGKQEPVPPPATAGVEAFQFLDQAESYWLVLAIRFNYRQRLETDEGKKDSTTSEPTASP